MSNLKQFIQTEAIKRELYVSYCGKSKTMFMRGNDESVKSFIRVCNLKGKNFLPFKVMQG
jgi:hypothetical protein